MYWLLFNQHYQHCTNRKLRSWANAVFQSCGVCWKAFPSLPSPSPHIPFFFCSRPNFLDELVRKRLLCRLWSSRFIFWFQPFIWVTGPGFAPYSSSDFYILELSSKKHFQNSHCEFYEQFSCRKRMFPIQSLEVECEVCLNHAEGLRWQNLFLAIVESAINEWPLSK